MLSVTVVDYLAVCPFLTASHDHGGRSGIVRQIYLLYRQIRVYELASEQARGQYVVVRGKGKVWGLEEGRGSCNLGGDKWA